MFPRSDNLKSAIVPTVVVIISIIAYLLGTHLEEIFIYKRSAIYDGEVWRLVTGHFFHTNFNHLLLNIVALIMLWSLHSKFYQNKSYAVLTLISGLFVSISILTLDPEMEQYVGLSGILHAVFTWGALQDIKAKDKTGYLLLAGVIVKIIYEQMGGSNEFTQNLIAAPVAINAHLYGVIVGAIIFFYAIYTNKKAEVITK